MTAGTATAIVPVEYAVAVERYLADADLGPQSRRVYRIALTSWAWPLVGKLPPEGRARRLASPPVVPLALLEHDDAGPRLAAAVAHRVRQAQARTVNRELSALRSAIGWWQDQRWIAADPTLALRQVTGRPPALPALTEAERAALFAAPAGLREHALWHLLQDSGAPADAVLALDASALDLASARIRSASAGWLRFGAGTCDLLGWLTAGRKAGPLFLTDRRAPADAYRADVCPLTGRGRMSYRRAAELFTQWTRPLDPAGHGWTLHQLRQPGGMLLAARQAPRGAAR
jgi:integrase